jgi:hypothetical protein
MITIGTPLAIGHIVVEATTNPWDECERFVARVHLSPVLDGLLYAYGATYEAAKAALELKITENF